MGSADIVPGVSGGTIALITGIYGHLVEAISKIKFGFIKPLLKGDFNGFLTGLFEEIDFEFFIPLVLGIGIAFLTLAKVVTYCMDAYTAWTYSFFLGLILASAVILFKKIDRINAKHLRHDIAGHFRFIPAAVAWSVQIHVGCPSSIAFHRNYRFCSRCSNRNSRIFKTPELSA